MGLTYKNKPEISEFIRKYQHIHPLLGEMRKTEQDHIWHQEGNVETHLSMVLLELYHDYGKPVTTRTDFRGAAASLREDFKTAVTSLARGYGAYTKIICLTTPWPECVRRDAKRHNSVGEMVIHEQFEKFQMPTSKEADSILFI